MLEKEIKQELDLNKDLSNKKLKRILGYILLGLGLLIYSLIVRAYILTVIVVIGLLIFLATPIYYKATVDGLRVYYVLHNSKKYVWNKLKLVEYTKETNIKRSKDRPTSQAELEDSLAVYDMQDKLILEIYKSNKDYVNLLEFIENNKINIIRSKSLE